MKNYIIFTFFLALFQGKELSAQNVPFIESRKTFGGAYSDFANSSFLTSDGGLIIAGSTNSEDGDVTTSYGSGDYWVVKVDESYNIEWQKSLGGSSGEVANSVIQTSEGGYILAGQSESNDGDVSGNHGDDDFWIVKLDNAGNIEWEKSMGGTQSDVAKCIIQTLDSGFLVAGFSSSNDGNVSGNHGNSDDWVVKLSAAGIIEWQKSLGGSGGDGGYSVIETSSGEYLIAGYSDSNDGNVSGNHGYADYWIVELDQSGNIKWQKCYGGSSFDVASQAIATTSGGFIITGSSQSDDGDVSAGLALTDYWVIELDSSGNLMWEKSFGGGWYDQGTCIIHSPGGGYILGGYSGSDNGDVSCSHQYQIPDYWIVEIDAAGSILWQTTLGGYNEDNATAIQLKENGNIVVTGSTLSFDADVIGSHGGFDIWVVELNTFKYIDWTNTYGGSAWDYATSVFETGDHGYIASGATKSNDSDVTGNHGSYDYWTLKVDSGGNVEWQKAIGGSGDDLCTSSSPASDGGYVLGGYSSSNDGDVSGNHGFTDYCIIKLDSVGNIDWQKSYGGTSGELAYSIQETLDGGFIVAGSSSSNDGDASGNHGDADYWVVKLDISGNIEWQRALGGSNTDLAYAVRQSADSGFIVVGHSLSNDGDVTLNKGSYDYWIVKLDNSGNIEWQKTYGGSSSDRALDVLQTADGNFIIAGHTSSSDGDVTVNHGPSDIWILKIDPTGNLIWQKTFGDLYGELAYSISQTFDGGFAIAGNTGSNGGQVSGGNFGNMDAWVIKLDSEGNLEWERNLGGSWIDNANFVMQSSDGSYLIAGETESDNGNITENLGYNDFWLVKLFCGEDHTSYADADGDTYGNTNVAVDGCNTPTGYVTNNLDCDDANPSINPGTIDIPNGIDDNCDGLIDEVCSSNFSLVADTLIPHHYWGLNTNTGIPPFSYLWSWGDGSFDSIAYPSHIYAVGGYYTICLSIQDSTGCFDSICIPYNIQKFSAENTIVYVDIVSSLPTSGIEEITVLQSCSVFPNPASANTNINYTLSSATRVSIELYDLFNHKLKQIINEDQQAGKYHSTINTEGLSNGIYVLQIHAGDQFELQKLVVFK